MSLLGTEVQDRRKWPRVSICEGNLFIQWQEEEKVIGVNAVLIDISQGGAMVMSPVAVPVHQLVQVTLKTEEPRWLAATVVGIVESRRWSQIRLEFREPCPESLLKAALNECVTEESWERRVTESETREKTT